MPTTCVHEMQWCACIAPSHEESWANLQAIMAYPEHDSGLGRVLAQPAHVLPVPSTDGFHEHDRTQLMGLDTLEADRDAYYYQSRELTFTRQLPRLTYPHWTVTTVAPATPTAVVAPVWVRWTERNAYGDVTDLSHWRES